MARFELQFRKEAEKELNELDGSVKILVKKALKKLTERANELGEPLRNQGGRDLTGCRKVKLKKAGIRIVYHIIGDRMEIVEILAIGNRSDYEVYEDAHKRLNW